MASHHEKMPMDSKKFIAYLIASLTWKAIIIIGLALSYHNASLFGVWGWWFMLTVAVLAAFIEVVYIGKQADLDRFVRVAEITAGQVGKNLPHVDPDNDPTDPGKKNA